MRILSKTIIVFFLTSPHRDRAVKAWPESQLSKGQDRDAAPASATKWSFSTVLPEDYDPDATHTLGLVGRRDLREFDLDRYVDNVVWNFVPSGNGEPNPREIVTTDTCSSRCHQPVLAEHGGRYQEIGICQQCHNPALVSRNDPTVSRDLNVVIHHVHEEAGQGTLGWGRR